MSRAIDVMYHGRDRVICAYEVGGVIVDPGPAVSVDSLVDGLGPTVPRALLLTHIHLDHAGGTGVLCRRFPELQVYVSEVGAPHLIDPSRLLASAARVYGEENMETLWGEVAPVPQERVHTVGDGDVVEGFRVARTPGHASHHVCYLHEDSGDAYVGDMAGVRIPPHDYTLMPTPPPEIDVEAWLDSLHAIAAWDPRALCLTHFGRVGDVEDQLHRARTTLLDHAEQARYAISEDFTQAVEADMRGAVDEDTADRFVRAIPPHQIWDGLTRYWRKRAEKEADAA